MKRKIEEMEQVDDVIFTIKKYSNIRNQFLETQ